jgi:hypothetical protein
MTVGDGTDMRLPRHDPLFMGSPLRRRGVCLVVCGVLLLLLAFATLVQFALFAGMRPDVMVVFVRALCPGCSR